ncbi:MAG: hypothetical protein ACI81L_002264 [Verrucomicrobiales bacterium]|jgi:hypothetical protein
MVDTQRYGKRLYLLVAFSPVAAILSILFAPVAGVLMLLFY